MGYRGLKGAYEVLNKVVHRVACASSAPHFSRKPVGFVGIRVESQPEPVLYVFQHDHGSLVRATEFHNAHWSQLEVLRNWISVLLILANMLEI